MCTINLTDKKVEFKCHLLFFKEIKFIKYIKIIH